MILGRNTQQWVGLISASLALLQVLLVTLVPGIDPVQIAVVLGAVGVFAGILVAFIANTYTTPISDPHVPAGTEVSLLNPEGKVIDVQTLTVGGAAAPKAMVQTHSGAIKPK